MQLSDYGALAGAFFKAMSERSDVALLPDGDLGKPHHFLDNWKCAEYSAIRGLKLIGAEPGSCLLLQGSALSYSYYALGAPGGAHFECHCGELKAPIIYGKPELSDIMRLSLTEA